MDPELDALEDKLAQLVQRLEALREENRELRLEKAALEDLKRIQTIANGTLGLSSPNPANVVVVERPQNLPKDSRLAAKAAPGTTQQQ